MSCHHKAVTNVADVAGLFGRGLPTKVASSGFQGAVRGSGFGNGVHKRHRDHGEDDMQIWI